MTTPNLPPRAGVVRPAFVLLVLLGIVVLGTAVGCRLGRDFGADPTATPASAIAGSTSIRVAITLPPAASLVGTGTVHAATATGPRQVTFTLSSINPTNTTTPVTVTSSTVTIDATGHASATFTGIPILPILADAHVTGGTIGSFTDFHGSRDLLPGSNTLTLEAKGSRGAADVVATVLERLIASPTLLARAPSPLVAGLVTLVSAVDRSAVAVYDNAFASAANSLTQGTAFTPQLGLVIGAASSTTIARLLGVNSGPSPVGESGNATVTVQYQQMGVESVRIHGYFGPLDMSSIYATHSADPNATASYNYTVSDQYYQQIVSGGFAPYFRIGDSMTVSEGFPVPTSRQPTNNANYIQAMIKIIAHYNDAARWGRAPITYVEIWNEPDFSTFWDGTQIEFINFFASAAVAIKAAYPNLKIGGPGFTMNGALGSSKQFVETFLSEMSARRVQLDFFSWHMYSNYPASYSQAAAVYRGMLDTYGYTATKMHNTEYHTDEVGQPAPEVMALRTGGKGAAVLTSAWIEFQNAGLEQAHVFRGADTNPAMPQFYGLCYADGRIKKTGLAYSLWKPVCDHPTRLAMTTAIGTTENIGLIAGQNTAGEITLLIANYGATSRTWSPMAASGADLLGRYTLTLKTVSDASDGIQSAGVTVLPITLPAYSVQLLTLTPR